MSARHLIAIATCASLPLAARSPTASQDQPSTARFGAATAGVVVDVVVRDKRGRPVTDLAREEFQVFEDGFAQSIVAFEPYTAADPPQTVDQTAAAAGLPAPRLPSTRYRLAEGPPITALAWDRLSPEARALAHRAAKRLVESKAPGELIGVFLTDLTLSTIAPYTTDTTKLLAAVEDLATRATSQQGRESSPIDGMVGRAQIAPTASASESGYTLSGFPQYVPEFPSNTAPGERPESVGVKSIVEMLVRMEQSYLQFLYETQGQASMVGLLSLVDSLGQVSGRKTVLYFCEGLTIPESQQARFRQVIETANRNNVSVYTFDAAGLRIDSAQQQTAREIRELTFTAQGLPQARSPKWSEELENNERLLKMDPAVSLAILAGQTGGLMTNNTNALDGAIDRINDDRRHHYLLSYVPTNAALDGTYRQITVQVKRPDVQVRARRGYKAAASIAATPVLEYEEAPLAALAASPLPTAFPVALRAMHTPLPGRPGLVSVFLAFNSRSLALGKNDERTHVYAGATVLARVLDERRRELARASQQYDLTAPSEQPNTIQAGAILFFKTAELPPGRHRVEAAAYDRMAEHNATATAEVTVTPPSRTWLAGDLIVVARVEPIAADAPGAASHPLVSGGRLFTPEPADPARRTSGGTLTFVLPITTLGELPGHEARIELRNTEGVARAVTVPIPAPGAGRVLLSGSLSLEGVATGLYELRAMIGETSRTASVRVVP